MESEEVSMSEELAEIGDLCFDNWIGAGELTAMEAEKEILGIDSDKR